MLAVNRFFGVAEDTDVQHMRKYHSASRVRFGDVSVGFPAIFSKQGSGVKEKIPETGSCDQEFLGMARCPRFSLRGHLNLT